ncbi:enhanced serine sensitivity protein SseB [Anaerosolibacter carboniphilus]|nr:enhanced serine sensitivity protein SseB [Anaerosolibacter carboniphilus]
MVDVNQPVTNPELVKSMNLFLKEKSAENEFNLIEKITQANYLVPVIFQGKIEDGVLKKDSIINFKVISNSSDESFYIAFTDWDELGKWSKEPEQTLISTYDDLKHMVLKSEGIKGFVINPFNQNFIITPEVIEYFSRRKSEIVIKQDTKIMLGQPANYPHEMIKALSNFFQKNKEIKSAYMFLAHKEEDQKPNLLFIVDFTGDKAVLFPRIAAIAQEFLGKDEYIDLVSLNSSFGKDATKNATPFYKRKKWKFF